MRRDSEVPLEVGDGISMQGCRNVSHIVLERCTENYEHDMLVLENLLSLSFVSDILQSFIIIFQPSRPDITTNVNTNHSRSARAKALFFLYAP